MGGFVVQETPNPPNPLGAGWTLGAEGDLRLAELARRQHGVVSIRQLRALGATRSAVHARVEAGRLHRIHTGVYAVGHRRLSQRGVWMAAVLALGRGALLSHRDGAALLGLRAPSGGRIHVTIGERSGRERRPGIILHRCQIHSEDRARVDGIPVTSIARTLLDLAGSGDRLALQRAYEAAERLELLDVRAIERILGRSSGRRGARALRELLGYDPSPAAQARSELEREFLDLIREAGLPTPQVNVLVDGYLVDAHWPQADLVVELQSWTYHRGRFTFERDHEKLAKLKLAGFEVLALTHNQLAHEASWVAGLIQRLLSRAARRIPRDARAV